jgi:hypothetical protein
LRTAAALQKQVTRDFGPLWNVHATVNAFNSLDDVPVDYWPIMIRTDIQTPGAAGVHEDQDGQPFALVQYSNSWTLTASHELLEMLGDPYGNRLIAGQSIKPDQGRVRYLVEVCDPCEGWQFSYRVNNVTLSDFFTPHFFDPTPAPGVRYSFGGNITSPRQVLRGGYISWENPVNRSWWQQTWFSGNAPVFRELGPMDQSSGESLRAQVDAKTTIDWRTKGVPARNRSLMASIDYSESEEKSTAARASDLRERIEEIKKR